MELELATVFSIDFNFCIPMVMEIQSDPMDFLEFIVFYSRCEARARHLRQTHRLRYKTGTTLKNYSRDFGKIGFAMMTTLSKIVHFISNAPPLLASFSA